MHTIQTITKLLLLILVSNLIVSFDLQLLSTDFEIGHFLRARIIPKAVLFYTGDIVDDCDDDEDDFDEEEEEEEDDEDDSDNDARLTGKQRGGGGGGGNLGRQKKPTAAGGNPAECHAQ